MKSRQWVNVFKVGVLINKYISRDPKGLMVDGICKGGIILIDHRTYSG